MRKTNKKSGLWEKPRVRIPISKVGGAMKDKKKYTRKRKHGGKPYD